jgi:hypothetical protein
MKRDRCWAITKHKLKINREWACKTKLTLFLNVDLCMFAAKQCNLAEHYKTFEKRID